MAQHIITDRDATAGAPILAYDPDTGLIVEAEVTLPMAPYVVPTVGAPEPWPMPGFDTFDPYTMGSWA
jgi:hypothetical protein